MEDDPERRSDGGSFRPLCVERSADLARLISTLRERQFCAAGHHTARIDLIRDAALAGASPYATSYPGARSDDGWIEERVIAIPADGSALVEWVATISALRAPPHATPAAEDQLRATVAAIGVGILTLDFACGTWALSAEGRAVLGLQGEAGDPRRAVQSCIDPDDRHSVAVLFEADLAAAGLLDATVRIVRPDTGAGRWVALRSRMIRDADGRTARLVVTLQDVTDRKRIELAQEANEARLNAALQIGRMIVWDLDIATGIVTRSANADDVLGVRKEPIVDFFGRIHPDDRHMVDWETAANPVPPSGDIVFRYHHPAGALLWLESSAIKISAKSASGHIVGITTDITERRLSEQRLIHAANHDPLTGLLNRKAWASLLDGLIVEAVQRRCTFHLLLLDVDHFKSINDEMGHDAGDALLQCIADRLTLEAPLIAHSARLGGDEFAAIIRADLAEDELQRLVEACVEELCRPVVIGDRSISISCSVGVASCPDHASSARDLAKNADLALYDAKKDGRRRARIFSPKLRLAVDARTSLHADFRNALSAGQIIPFYQPKHDLRTGALVGFEALARWVHPRRGLLTPAVFGSVFDDGDLTRGIGKAIRTAVFGDLNRWLSQGLQIGRVAVNCASHDFVPGDLADIILNDLSGSGVPAAHFEIEVTEGVMIEQHAETVKRTMSRLHDAGVKISLDDFGTGYASLIHLKQFPVDEIKIDYTFVKDMDHASNAAIIMAIVGMGQSLGLTTVAEGVETLTQANALLRMGCTQAQGFLFGKPMSADRVPWLVRSSKPRSTFAKSAQLTALG